MTAHPITLAPQLPAHDRRDLINAAFLGKITPLDLVHMARALLQLSDEMAEMRKRVAEMAIERKDRV